MLEEKPPRVVRLRVKLAALIAAATAVLEVLLAVVGDGGPLAQVLGLLAKP